MPTVKSNHPVHPQFHERISVRVGGQLPQFIKQDHETFVSFMEAYYEYMEQLGKPYEIIGNLPSYANIDKTVDDFLQYFKKQFGEDIPESIFQNSNKPFVIKHLRDFYRTKGSLKSFEFLFRLLFNEEIDIDIPGENILRISDGKFDSNYILRSADTSSDISTIAGKKVEGNTSGATAIVESVIIEIIGGTQVSTMFLSEVFGVFEAGEIVTDGTKSFTIGNIIVDTEITNAGTGYSVNDIIPLKIPYDNTGALIRVKQITTGSLSNININIAGTGYKVGDKLDIDNTGKLSLDGRTASVLVNGVNSEGGITSLFIENSGNGYIALPSVAGGSGTGANISFVLAGSGIGGVKSLDINNGGFSYNDAPELDFSVKGDGTATATAIIGGFDTTPKSRFINSDGFLSGNKFIQDSSFYQLFSYEIASTHNINEWRDIVKRLVHPAGLALFGKIQFVTSLSSAMSISSVVPDTEDRYTIVFHDGDIEPPHILDLTIESCDDAQDSRVLIPSDDYGGFSLEDEKEDYQPSPEILETTFSSQEDYQPSSETLATAFSSQEDYGSLFEPASTIASADFGCPGDEGFPFQEGICSPTDFGLITDNDTNSGQQDLGAEDYGKVSSPDFIILPTKCQTYEKILGIQKLTETDGVDDYLYTYITPAGSFTGRSDTTENYGSVEEAVTNKEDYGVVSFHNTYFGTQLKLGPILRTRDNTKFHPSYLTSDNKEGIHKVEVFDGGDGFKVAPTVTIDDPFLNKQATVGVVTVRDDRSQATASNATTRNGVTAIANDATIRNGVTSTASNATIRNGVTAIASDATLLDGVIDSIVISDGGTDYTTPPTVTVSSSAGTGENLEAVIDANGTVTSINVLDGGVDFVEPVVVTLSEPQQGIIDSIVISDGGTDYTTPPTVTVSSSAGTGENLEAVIENGIVTSINVLDGGVDFVSPVVVTLSAPQQGILDSIVISDGGLGYEAAPTVTVSSSAGTGENLEAVIDANGIVTSINVLDGGVDFVSPVVVTLSAPEGGVLEGIIDSIEIVDGGLGYEVAPTITVSSSAGTGENLEAVIDAKGVVTSINIVDGGSNFVEPVVITLSAPPPDQGTTAIAQAYFKNPLKPEVQIGVGDNTTTPLVLIKEVADISHISVSLNGLTQIPNVDYTVSGTVLTFDEVVEPLVDIVVYHLNYNDEYSVQTGVGDDTTTPVILTQNINNAQDIIVSLNGLTQIPDVDYTVSGTVLTFDEVVDTTENIVVYYLGDGFTNFQVGQGDDTATPITLSQEVLGSINSSESKTEHIMVMLNGVRQNPITDFTIDGTTLTFDEPVDISDSVLVYFLEEQQRSSGPDFDYVAGIAVIKSGSGYDSNEGVPNITISPSETGETVIATVVMLRGPYYTPINSTEYKTNFHYTVFRGNKTNRVVDPTITQYKLIPDPNNPDSFLEASPPFVMPKLLKDDEILENV